MKPLRSPWKLPVVCGVAIAAAMRFGAPTIVPAAPTPAPSVAPSPMPDYAAEVAKIKTADALSDYISKYATIADIEPDDSLPQEEQVAQVRKLIDRKIAQLRPAIDAFLKQYPQDPRRWDVQLQRLFFLKEAENISDKEFADTLHAVAAAPDATANARHRARSVLLQNALEEIDPIKGITPGLEKLMSDFERDFPDDEGGKELVQFRVQLLQAAGPDKLTATLETLIKSPNKSTAEAADSQLALLTRPIDLKFDSATDGKPVDLSKLRGKVVLLDFWATWCGPCMAKLPEIQKLNARYKDKDFQLIGISLDQDKAALLKTTEAKGMDWPEYFDGKPGENAVAIRFGVQTIPAVWLLDKKGLAHAVPQEADVDAEIARLLDEKP